MPAPADETRMIGEVYMISWWSYDSDQYIPIYHSS
jgi:hypothetical protein